MTTEPDHEVPDHEARIRVAVVDDDASVREALRVMLTTDDRFELVGVTDGGWKALELVGDWDAEIIVLDQVMPGGDGMTILSRLSRWAPNSKVVLFTGRPETARGAYDGGVAEVLTKPMEPSKFLDRLVAVARG